MSVLHYITNYVFGAKKNFYITLRFGQGVLML